MAKFKEEFEKHKDDLANGPIQKRFITDWWCCALFIVFCCGMIAVFVYGMMYGTPTQITIGWDEDGRGCGYSPGVENYPYLYFAKPPTVEQFNKIT